MKPGEPDWSLIVECLFRTGMDGHEIGEAVGHNNNWTSRWRRGVGQRMSWPDGEALIALARERLDATRLVACRVPGRG